MLIADVLGLTDIAASTLFLQVWVQMVSRVLLFLRFGCACLFFGGNIFEGSVGFLESFCQSCTVSRGGPWLSLVGVLS